MWVTRRSIVDWASSKTQILLESWLVDSKSNSAENLVYFRKSNIRSHNLGVQEANVSVSQFHRIGSCFFGAGLRGDGIPALDLWDVVVDVLHSSNNKKSSTQEASGNRSGFKEASGKLLAHVQRQVEKR